MPMLSQAQYKLLELLAKYQPAETGQQHLKVLFSDFVTEHANACERTCLPGHITGSAWLVSADDQRVALMQHRKLARWLQPGGHADGNADIAAVALREAKEETGLTDLMPHSAIFDLDAHQIPARGHEPEHWHYDIRFVLQATCNEAFIQNEESLALAWINIADLIERPDIDESIKRMARKWIDR